MSLIKRHTQDIPVTIYVDPSYQPQHPMFQNTEGKPRYNIFANMSRRIKKIQENRREKRKKKKPKKSLRYLMDKFCEEFNNFWTRRYYGKYPKEENKIIKKMITYLENIQTYALYHHEDVTTAKNKSDEYIQIRKGKGKKRQHGDSLLMSPNIFPIVIKKLMDYLNINPEYDIKTDIKDIPYKNIIDNLSRIKEAEKHKAIVYDWS